MNAAGKMRVLVCGTRFGQVYLEALRTADPDFELAGVLATGSERSRACARHYEVPLFTGPEQIPDDVDIACVVIRGGLLGGPGSDLSRTLLERGVHVLQEHPVHHDELAATLRTARRHRRVYHLNSFYVHTSPVRRFLAAAAELLSRRQPRYVDAACGFQLAYSLLDILGQSLGGVRPWAFGDLPELPPGARTATRLDLPFRSLDGVLGGVPVTLRVQNQMDPADPDNYAHLMHRVSIGTEAGNLTLVSTHGPVVWTARPDFPREVTDERTTPHFGEGVPDPGVPSATVIGPRDVPSHDRVFGTVWPAGVRRALGGLREAILTEADPLPRGQYHLALCRLWQELTARLGPPELLHADRPDALTGSDLDAMAAAAAAVDEPAPAVFA